MKQMNLNMIGGERNKKKIARNAILLQIYIFYVILRYVNSTARSIGEANKIFY